MFDCAMLVFNDIDLFLIRSVWEVEAFTRMLSASTKSLLVNCCVVAVAWTPSPLLQLHQYNHHCNCHHLFSATATVTAAVAIAEFQHNINHDNNNILVIITATNHDDNLNEN